MNQIFSFYSLPFTLICLNLSPVSMPSFRFRIPFFSYGSSSRLSSESTSLPPPPPPPSRPPFRPAGIAQPSKPETKSKVPSSLSRVKSNVKAIASSSFASQSPSSSAGTPTRRVKQSNQSGSPLKKLESLRTEENKVTIKEKPSGETTGDNINAVIEKPPVASRGEHSERKEAEAVQEQRKKTEIEKLAAQERKKVLSGKKKLEADEGQEQRKETKKLTSQETKRGLRDQPEGKTETQNRREIHSDDNHQKTKGVSSSNLRVPNGEGSSSLSRGIKKDIRDGISKLTWGKSNSDEKSVSVITLTGENRGATMAIASEKDEKHGQIHIHRGYKSNPDESPSTTTATETEEERKQFQGENHKDEEKEATVKAYVNGNAQGINNSIVLESSVSQNDPGIHMSLKFEEFKKETMKPSEKEPETEKTKNTPRIRRRCLRGLLAESSESDPENPLKPRRHGCRFTCKDKDIENL